jgi:hypothetical protein
MHTGFPMIPGKTFFLSRGERPVFRRYRRDKKPSGGARDYYGEYEGLIVPLAPLSFYAPENLPGGQEFDTWVAERQKGIGRECDVYFVHGWINSTLIRQANGESIKNDTGDPYYPGFSYFLLPKEFELKLDRGQP